MRDSRERQGAPREDEVEVALLGPGYGESIVVHVGAGRWIIVDSCISDAGTPQALDYLLSMGIDPAETVDLIVATHWHDDHIRGMNALVESCRNAEFCCAAAFRCAHAMALGRARIADAEGYAAHPVGDWTRLCDNRSSQEGSTAQAKNSRRRANHT